MSDVKLPELQGPTESIMQALQRNHSELLAALRESAEAKAEVAACLDFLQTELGWQHFRAEFLCHDNEEKQVVFLDNARKLKNFLSEKGHGIKFLSESAADKQRIAELEAACLAWQGSFKRAVDSGSEFLQRAVRAESAADKQRIAELETQLVDASAGYRCYHCKQVFPEGTNHFGKYEEMPKCIENPRKGMYGGHDDPFIRVRKDVWERAERAESELATRLKMFVWDGRGKYKVTVCAADVAEARALALEEMSIKGDLLNMREHVEQKQPLIYHRANAEIALTESGETEELNLCLEAETKRRKAVESELAIARDLIERHKQEEPGC